MTVRLTNLQGSRLECESGEAVGRIVDLVVRLDAPEPKVVRIHLRKGRRKRDGGHFGPDLPVRAYVLSRDGLRRVASGVLAAVGLGDPQFY